MNRHDIDEMWGTWMAHYYQEAMELAGVPEETQRRVLSMVLLGSPDGLDIMARQHIEQLYKDALAKLPPHIEVPIDRMRGGIHE